MTVTSSRMNIALNFLRLKTLEDWPNVVLHGIDVNDETELILTLARNLSGCPCREMKQEVVPISFGRPTDTTFPLIALDMGQDYDALSSFLKDYLSKRSIVNMSKRHVVVVRSTLNSNTQKDKLLKRVLEQYSYNAIFVVLARRLGDVPRCIRDRCATLNMVTKSEQETEKETEIEDLFASLKNIKKRSDFERVCRAMNAMDPEACLRHMSIGSIACRDPRLAAEADHMWKRSKSWPSVVRWLVRPLRPA